MLFKRKNKQSLVHRIRDIVFPRKGWRRGVKYMGHRVKRLPDSPHNIALGGGIGIFTCFSPLFGLHMAFAVIVSFLLRANVLAAFLTTFFGNPLTYPFIVAGSINLGRWILGRSSSNEDYEAVHTAFWDAVKGLWQTIKSWFGSGESALDEMTAFLTDVFIPYNIGGTILGAIAGAIFYFLFKPAIRAYQHMHVQRMNEVRAKQNTKADSDE
ncbi:MAG: DUF2062 domain-containing protein [Alphaproteobacteria bacterium]